VLPAESMSRALSLAGFQVTLIGRIWVTPEDNSEQLVPLLADKFVSTEIDGKVNSKAETIARAKASKYESAEYSDLKVTVFGDTAIATGGFKGKGTDESGKPFDIYVRWTDTWVKMPSGKWQCVASHGSTIKT